MINLVYVQSPEMIKKALLHDQLYQGMYSSLIWDDTLIDRKGLYFIGYNEKNDPIGVLELIMESKTSIAIHAGIYKKHRGNGTAILTDTVKRVKAQFPNHVLWTKVAGSNIKSRKAVEGAGASLMAKLDKADGDEALYFYKWE